MKSTILRTHLFSTVGLCALALVSVAIFLDLASPAGATTVTWNGASAVPTANWSDSGNWAGGVAPVAGQSLVFDGSTQLTNSNDFAAGTNFAGIDIAATGGAFTLNGNSINLSGDLENDRTSATTSTMATPFVLQQNVQVNVPSSTGSLTLTGGISGTGFGITKNGAGLAISNTAMTYTGGTAINGGTLRTGNSGSTTAILGTGAISFSNGSTLDLRSTTATTFNNDLSLGAGGGTIAVRTNDTFSPNSISGAGTLGFTGESTNLVMTITDFKSWNGQVNVSVSGTSTPFGLRLATAYVNNSALNMAISLTTASANIAKQNGTSGTTVIDIGTLSGVAGSTVGGSAAGAGTFVYSVGNRNENSTFAGTILDGSTHTGLTKVGTATLQLTGTDTYTGATTINKGELQVGVAGIGSLGNSAVTVNSTGILGGTGSLAGTVTSIGGTLAPGDSPGTLSINNSLTTDAATAFNYDLNGGNNAIGGGTNDLITGVTNLALSGTLNIAETVPGSFATATAGTEWRLINYSGTLSGAGLAIGTQPTLPAGDALSIDTSTAGQVNLLLSVAVPEPSSLALLALAGVALVAVGRKARHSQES